MRVKRILPLTCLLTAPLAWGFDPPADVQGGVAVAIHGFDETPVTPPTRRMTRVVDGAKPLEVRVSVSNRNAVAVAGVLRISMNDDWMLDGVSENRLSLAAGQGRTVSLTARALSRVLPAVYPVHACFVRDGVELAHAVALFRVSRLPCEKKAAKPLHTPDDATRLGAESAESLAERRAAAVRLARRAVGKGASPAEGCFVLAGTMPASDKDERCGVGIVPGIRGVLDAVVAFSDGMRDYSFAGFECEVDGRVVGIGEKAIPVATVKRQVKDGALVFVHETEDCGGRQLSLRARLWADRGTLRVAWDMPGAVRGKDGSPRYTRLASGIGSLPPERVYAGFGNVFVRPKGLQLRANGFTLSTRHSGADFANGLSLVIASDIFPDRLSADCGKRTFSLATHHDATFLFTPSSRGAFDAARRYAAVSGFRAAPGVRNLIGRMCLDQWGGDYQAAADGLARAAVYGLGGSVFVRHTWQRWGYDYRLPDICPPRGDGEAFRRMRAAAKNAGMLFVPHDNYIDLYPDAEGFSYDRTAFRADGQPEEAWFNKGRAALSYRWAPHAFAPVQERNLKLMRGQFDPDGLFIDVFSAIAPMDYHDRNGAFHGKWETVAAWSAAFDRPRQVWAKPSAPTVSEAGGDWLIGHLDAGQSDHFLPARWANGATYDDADRVPWHDIVSHGKFVLMAGGLGFRYCAPGWGERGDDQRHGYASDDYFCTTVIGGRLPMCEGPFTRGAVLTHWMLRDVCAELGAGEMRALGFDETIHRQHATFSTGEVWINRETNRTWRVAGRELPSYGFYVKTPRAEAGVERRDGLRVGFARTEETRFADARPPLSPDQEMPYVRAEIGDGVVSGLKVAVPVRWTLAKGVREGYVPFVHVERMPCPKAGPVSRHGRMLGWSGRAFGKKGVRETSVAADFADIGESGEYALFFGLFLRGGGGRLNIDAENDGNNRVKGGVLTLTTDSNGERRLSWKPPAAEDDRLADMEFNREGRIVDFGGLRTSGAVKLEHGANWRLLPLPRAYGFKAEIDLAKFGAAGRKVAELRPELADLAPPTWRQKGDELIVDFPPDASPCRVCFER